MKTPLVPGAAVLALAAALVAGCGETSLDTRTFPVRHLGPGAVASLLDPYVYGDRPEQPGRITVSDGAVTVRETDDNLERIARVLADFDRPRPGLRLRFQLVEADGFQAADSAIGDVVEELRALFRFQGYRLAGESVLQVSDGAAFGQSFPGLPFHVSGHAFGRGTGLRLEELTLQGPGATALRTSVSVDPGQTLVLGSAGRSQDEGGGTFILVVRADEPPGDDARQ